MTGRRLSPAQRAVLARRPGRLRVLAVLAVEHPEALPLPQRVALHDEARAWLLEGGWPVATREGLDVVLVRDLVHRHYGGGWPAFVLANLDLLQPTTDKARN